MSTVASDEIHPPLLLAIDIGTSSVRAIVFDRLGRAVEGIEARQAHEIRTTTEGASEADPDILLGLVWKCIDHVLARGEALARQISGVAACTFVGNILGVDRTGQAITPLVTYADTRADSEVAGLRADFNEDAVHDRTGCHFHPSYLPAFFRWFARNQSDLFRRVERWLTIGEYLELRLFGQAAITYSVASWTGLLDRHRLVWDEILLSGLPAGIAELSPLTDINSPRRSLCPEFAARWPALREVPWYPAVGDGAAANIGSGCLSSKQVALTMGTTTALRAVTEDPVKRVPEGLWCYRVDRRRSLPGGALSEGGSVYAWMKAALNLEKSADLEETLTSFEPDHHGLTILPFLTGERSPGWAGHARGAVDGLSLATTPSDILRAGIEAVAYRIALVFELLSHLLPDNPEVIASGGALLNSPAWIQIITDVLGRPVAVSEVQETSARGAALLALEALGTLKDLTEAPPFMSRVYEPNLAHHSRYREAIERQKRLYERLIKGR